MVVARLASACVLIKGVRISGACELEPGSMGGEGVCASRDNGQQSPGQPPGTPLEPAARSPTPITPRLQPISSAFIN